jgi:hypothetical protein
MDGFRLKTKSIFRKSVQKMKLKFIWDIENKFRLLLRMIKILPFMLKSKEIILVK